MKTAKVETPKLPPMLTGDGRYRISTFKVDLAVARPTPEDFRLPDNPDAFKDLVRAVYATLEPDQEHSVVFFIDANQRVSGYRHINSGTAASCPADVNRTLRDALLMGAWGVIAVHNHPSGGARPSAADAAFIDRLKYVADAANIMLLDGMILAQPSGEVYSFAEHNLMDSMGTGVPTIAGALSGPGGPVPPKAIMDLIGMLPNVAALPKPLPSESVPSRKAVG